MQCVIEADCDDWLQGLLVQQADAVDKLIDDVLPNHFGIALSEQEARSMRDMERSVGSKLSGETLGAAVRTWFDVARQDWLRDGRR
jgi:hypothetical protein